MIKINELIKALDDDYTKCCKCGKYYFKTEPTISFTHAGIRWICKEDDICDDCAQKTFGNEESYLEVD